MVAMICAGLVILLVVLLVANEKELDLLAKILLVVFIVATLFGIYAEGHERGQGGIPPINSEERALKAGELYITQSVVKDPVEEGGFVAVLSSENGWIVRRLCIRPPDAFVVAKDGKYVPISPKDYRLFPNLFKK